MRILTVQTAKHGDVVVTRAIDEAGNIRMIPMAGAATISEWRADKSLLPPWLLDGDLANPETFGDLLESMAE